MSLPETSLIQRNILLTHGYVLLVPICFSMAQEDKGCVKDYVSVSRYRITYIHYQGLSNILSPKIVPYDMS